mmetsp:Transcript_17870/g.51185  ORF Transcript_17870/g.51185 Transcript_17870/m.51185 type:complete len:252 (-) Transcript_17870:1666-2421(-)
MKLSAPLSLPTSYCCLPPMPPPGPSTPTSSGPSLGHDHRQDLADAGLLRPPDYHHAEASRRLSTTPRRLAVADPCPSSSFVNCIGGYAYEHNDSTAPLVSGSKTTCAAACGGCCCCDTPTAGTGTGTTTDVCAGATACIQKDDSTNHPTCSGKEACYDLFDGSGKPVIANGPCVGDVSCRRMDRRRAADYYADDYYGKGKGGGGYYYDTEPLRPSSQPSISSSPTSGSQTKSAKAGSRMKRAKKAKNALSF